ncbi:SDR family NAD(P)-dependent oxidoreductase [Williamsia herbipolensis]|uniref:SDR family NAD(P)-dependent oxidoreductase n=1 Tax=Williamsia herbipolensis TaxID=1603258 RepID=A0AAU4K0M0_9NOCA|nr:SDR family NAD(P)-dependent oxidoreductase [Williamsia herbipolensis]
MSRRVIVTGGASGLGAALVERFAARGDRVLVTDLAEEYSGPQGTTYRRLDVVDADDWADARDHVMATWGGVDIVVNNAGIAAGGRIDVVTLEEWRRIIDINLLGVVRGCQTFVPVLKDQAHRNAAQKGSPAGQIVNIASMAGLVHPPAMASYNVVKAGVVALSETLSFELEPWGITTSVVCPSFFRTNLSSSLAGSDGMLDQIAARLIDRSDTGADEVADAVIAGVDARRPVILTDRAGRKAFFAKRFARPLYTRQMLGMSRRIHGATASAPAAADHGENKQ